MQVRVHDTHYIVVGTRERGLERGRCAQVGDTVLPVSLVTVAEWTVARVRRRT